MHLYTLHTLEQVHRLGHIILQPFGHLMERRLRIQGVPNPAQRDRHVPFEPTESAPDNRESTGERVMVLALAKPYIEHGLQMLERRPILLARDTSTLKRVTFHQVSFRLYRFIIRVQIANEDL